MKNGTAWSASDQILIVDDESVIRELLSDILSEEGYRVVSVPNGPAALERIETDAQIIILFTDIMMPEMDGIELIRTARRIRPELIPIVMTGFATLETARDAVREGAYDYVLKPFSLSEVKLAVSNAIERYQLTNENARLREITELFNISETVASIHEEKRLLRFVLDAVLERISGEAGAVVFAGGHGAPSRVAAEVGVDASAYEGLEQISACLENWPNGRPKPLLVRDMAADPRTAPVASALPGPSLVSMPLVRKQTPGGSVNGGSELLAVLHVSGRRDGEPFTEGDLKTLSIIANHTSAALQNARLIRDVEEAHLATLESMASLLEAKDAYTHGHSQRVRSYAKAVAERFGLPQEDVDAIDLGAALHDIGKVGVHDSVLTKVEALTSEEFESIKQHPLIGYDILKTVRFLAKPHLDLVRSHHERYDGSGYPDRLQGEAIPVGVRILSVADAYDAMTSNRAYRQALPKDKVVSELQDHAGRQFDPAVVTLFVELIREGLPPQGA